MRWKILLSITDYSNGVTELLEDLFQKGLCISF